MRKKKIEKIVFEILALIPLIFLAVYHIIYISAVHNTGTIPSTSDFISTINTLGNELSMNTDFTNPIYYLLHNIFAVNEYLSHLVANYIMWLILMEFIHILYDLIVFIPRILRSLIDRGINS